MNRATPQMRHFAKRLIVFETRENKFSATENPAAFYVSDKLRLQLAALMGTAGFRALLLRSLALAAAEVPWMRGVQVKVDGAINEPPPTILREKASVENVHGRFATCNSI